MTATELKRYFEKKYFVVKYATESVPQFFIFYIFMVRKSKTRNPIIAF